MTFLKYKMQKVLGRLTVFFIASINSLVLELVNEHLLKPS